jgi:hypothetical protein
MDEATVAKAKEIAHAQGTSVSAMVSNIVRSMATGKTRPIKIGPITRRATGIAKWPAGKEYKELLEEALMEKYGIKE